MPTALANSICDPRGAKNSASVIPAKFSAPLKDVNSAPRIHFVSISLLNSGVPTIDQIYRDNLAILRDEAKGLTNLAIRIGKSPAQVSQWINASADSKTGKPRVLSRAMARYIEGRCGKNEGWMDQPHSEEDATVAVPSEGTAKGSVYHALSPEELEMLDNWRHMSDTDRRDLAPDIAARAETFQSNLAKAVADNHIRLPFPVTRQHASERARSVISKASAEPSGQGTLDLDDPKKPRHH